MIGDISMATNVYIVCGRTDMRKSINGLCAIIQEQFHREPDKNSIFLFCENVVIGLRFYFGNQMVIF